MTSRSSGLETTGERFAFFALLGAAAFMLAGPALPYDKQQELLLNDIARALAIGELCPSLDVDPQTAGVAMYFYQLKQRDIGEIQSRAVDHMSALTPTGVERICDRGAALFGEKGSKVTNMLKAHAKP